MANMSSDDAPALCASVTVTRAGQDLTVIWQDGHQSRFDAIWLFDNAPENRDASTGQRLIDAMELPEKLAILAAYIGAEGAIPVIFTTKDDAREVKAYAADWLRAHCYCENERSQRFDRPVLWSAPDPDTFCWMDAEDFSTSPAGRCLWLSSVATQGIGFLRNAPVRQGTVLELARLVGFVRETNYGRMFDVRPQPAPNNLAYSDRGLGLHTDNPYRNPVPGLQMLHCLKNSAPGGDSIFADGFAAAGSLREEDPSSFKILTSTPVRFEFHDRNTALVAERPMIELNYYGEIEGVRWNDRAMAPLRLQERSTARFYKAYRAFAERLNSPRFKIDLRLNSGDVVLFDNTRILHGRGGFDGAKQARHLQGCYIDRDGMLSTIAVLSRTI